MKKKVRIISCSLALTVATSMGSAIPVFENTPSTNKVTDQIVNQVTSQVTQNVSTAHRLAGIDRYATAVAISQNGWSTSETVILASGEDYADALTAGPLAQKYDAPILLTSKTSISSQVLAEIVRLKAKNIIIIGREGAISLEATTQLTKAGNPTITRIGGVDRYETSTMVAAKLDKPSAVAIVSGEDFPDALSISSIASKLGYSIILSEKSGLSDSAKQYIATNGIKKAYIIGGQAVLSSALENQVSDPVRLAGADRYETNLAVIKAFHGEFNYDNVFLATGDKFADALAGGALASKSSSPMILVGHRMNGKTADYVGSKSNLNTRILALGGEGTISNSTIKSAVDDKSTIAVTKNYSSAGTYEGEAVTGSVIISRAGVNLKNTTISGDLLIASTIGEGKVDLDNVTVTGKIIVNGGGESGVKIHNMNSKSIEIDKAIGEKVGVAIDAASNIDKILVFTNGIVDVDYNSKVQSIVAKNDVLITGMGLISNITGAKAGINVDLKAKTIGSVFINEVAAGSKINISSDTTVTNLNVNAAVTVSGTGKITNANIGANGTTISMIPGVTSVIGAISVIVNGNIKNSGNSDVIVRVPVEGEITVPVTNGSTTSSYTAVSAISAITEIAQVGSVLTCGTLTPSGATVSYQWKICDTLDSTYVNITGATTNKYTPVPGDAAKFIKVSVTGTGGYAGTVISAATAKVTNTAQLAPTETLAGVAPTSYGFSDGKITGTTNLMEYKLSTASTYTLATVTEVTGLIAGTYNVRYAAKTGFNAGTTVDVIVAVGANVAQAAPIGLVGVATTSYGLSNGKITGTTTLMEYKLSTDETYTAATVTEVAGLAAGTYNVRYAAKTGFDAGTTVDVIVAVGANVAQAAPTGLVSVAPTSYGLSNGKITGITNLMEYKLSTASTYTAGTVTEVTGLVSGTYNVRYAAKTGFNAGTTVDVVVAVGANLAQASPAGLVGVATTSYGLSDGKITGTTTLMEYKLSTASTYTTATVTEVAGLAAGTYNVRYAAKTGFNAGATVDVVVTLTVTTGEGYFTFAGNEITGYNIEGGKNLIIPETIGGVAVNSIGINAFRAKGITSLVIPNSVTNIDAFAFSENYSLTSVTIPNSVTTIGNYAFQSNGLTSIMIPNSVTIIGEQAFRFNNLTSIDIPNSVNTIGELAFANNKLISVRIPNSITSLELAVFAINELTSITIPNSITSIKSEAFSYNKLTSVIIPDSVITIDSQAFIGNSLANITIGENVTTIGNLSFSYNQLLTSVTIPNSVTSLGERAFDNDNLNSITIGPNVIIGNKLLDTNGTNLFRDAYVAAGKTAGTYTGTQLGSWSKVTSAVGTAAAVANEYTITYTLTTGTFDALAGIINGNWTIEGPNGAELTPIVRIELNDARTVATITVTNPIGALGQIYTVAPAPSAFAAGFIAPAAVVATVMAPLTSDASLHPDTTLNGYKLTYVTPTKDGLAESSAIPLKVMTYFQFTDIYHEVLVPITDNATVTAYADQGSGGGTYAPLTSYNFQMSRVLWIKIVSQDGSTTRFYKLDVSVF